MSIVCIGDSLTFGYGVNNCDNWVSIMSKRLNEKMINRGIPGDTTYGMSERFMKDVVVYKPLVVTIMGGTNDIFLKKRINSILNNIKIMVELCLTNNIVPLILTPLPVKENILIKLMFEDMDYKEVNEKLFELRKSLIIYGNESNIKVIDLGNIVPKKINIEKYFLADGIHVSKEVHKVMAETIYSGNIYREIIT